PKPQPNFNVPDRLLFFMPKTARKADPARNMAFLRPVFPPVAMSTFLAILQRPKNAVIKA
ncbi:MAG: hypothetical protein LUD50_06380, partial [Clostridia bacterium]|nr:hypothetical protein [Clostridia bacterium]